MVKRKIIVRETYIKSSGDVGPVQPPPKLAKTHDKTTQHAVGVEAGLMQDLETAVSSMQGWVAHMDTQSHQLAHTLNNPNATRMCTLEQVEHCLIEQAQTLLHHTKTGCVHSGTEAHSMLVHDWLCMHKHRGTHKHTHMPPLLSTTAKPPTKADRIPTPCKAIVSLQATKVSRKRNTLRLNKHKRDTGAVVNDGPVLACSQCEKRYTDASLLEQHVKTKHTVSDHQCHICNKYFVTARVLKLHMDSVHEGVRLQCPTCDKVFAQMGSLATHVKSIHEDQKFACKECGKQFSQKSNLKTHCLVHNGAKPHVCDKCGKGFTQANNLSRHRNTAHLHIKPHQCLVCEKRFAHAGHMKQHIRLVHSNVHQ